MNTRQQDIEERQELERAEKFRRYDREKAEQELREAILKKHKANKAR